MNRFYISNKNDNSNGLIDYKSKAKGAISGTVENYRKASIVFKDNALYIWAV